LEIAPESRRFLVELFTDLRNDLEEQLHEPRTQSPEPDKGAGKLEMYEALLAGLNRSAAFPDDDSVRKFISGLAEAVDQANKYEQAVLEHRALAELCDVLGSQK